VADGNHAEFCRVRCTCRTNCIRRRGSALDLGRLLWHKNPVPIELKTVDYYEPVARILIGEMEDDLAQFYGERHYPPQDVRDWSAPHGAMVVALWDGDPAACGGLTRLDGDTAEPKRMFTRVSYRRRGVAAMLLSHLEGIARDLGYSMMALETGLPQVDAQRLYLSAGYQPMHCWPPHDRDETSVCFGRALGGVRSIP
jgi:GNAT superfamily N-acetyltransferase